MKRSVLYIFAALLALCVQNMLMLCNAHGQQSFGNSESRTPVNTPSSADQPSDKPTPSAPYQSDELLRGQKQWIVFDLINVKEQSVNISYAWVCSRKLTGDNNGSDYKYLAQAKGAADAKAFDAAVPHSKDDSRRPKIPEGPPTDPKGHDNPCRYWPTGAEFYFVTGTLIYIEVFPRDDTLPYMLAHTDVQIVAEKLGPQAQEAAVPIKEPTHNAIVMFLGQYTANTRVSFTVCEGPGTCGAAPKQTNSGSGAKDKSSPAPAATTDQASTCCTNATTCCCCCTCSQTAGTQTAPKGTNVANGDIEVHKVEHGNLVGGFFISSLPSQQYGVTNNGQSTTVTYVAVVGPAVRPQYHAFTGIDIDFFGRDTFPGGAGKQHFLGIKKSGLNGYWNPNVLVGYGVDTTNNFLLGANWVTKWGIDLGGGLHVGQITQLQPGIIPGLTVLPSTATSPPTYNRVGYGRYISVGFDLNTIRSAFNIFGGSKVASQ